MSVELQIVPGTGQEGRARQAHRAAAEAGAAAVDGALATDGALGAGNTSGPFWPQPPSSNAHVPASKGVSRRTVRLGFEGRFMLREIDSMSTAPACPAATALTDAEYSRETQALLARIEAAADRWLQDDVIDIDTARTGGLLELAFPDGSRIVVNTQPPLQELWMAARAGGFHYRWVAGRWLDTRDGSEFLAALSRHASAQAGKPLTF